MDELSIQTLDVLRQLIAETQGDYSDMAILRMLQGSGMGTDGLTTQQEDR